MINYPSKTEDPMNVFQEHEKYVYDAINEYLNENRILEFSKVIPYLSFKISRSSINLNTQGIMEILKSLVEKNLIVEGSKLTKEKVLLTSNRRKIYEFILKNPGTYKYLIQKELNLSNHTVIWHLNVLLEFQFIEKLLIDGRDVYLEPGLDKVKVEKSYYLTNDKAKAIIEYLKDTDVGVIKNEIARDLKFHPKTISKYLEVLENMKIVEKEEYLGNIVYYLK